MLIAIGSDEKTHLTDFVIEDVKKRGYEVKPFGPLKGEPLSWVEVGEQVASFVAQGNCPEGILFCWTGTGVSIVANKIPGIRAALCVDAKTAEGAKKWDHANILTMSLRFTSEPLASEILDAWFSTPWGSGGTLQDIAKLTDIERRYR